MYVSHQLSKRSLRTLQGMSNMHPAALMDFLTILKNIESKQQTHELHCYFSDENVST